MKIIKYLFAPRGSVYLKLWSSVCLRKECGSTSKDANKPRPATSKYWRSNIPVCASRYVRSDVSANLMNFDIEQGRAIAGSALNTEVEKAMNLIGESLKVLPSSVSPCRAMMYSLLTSTVLLLRVGVLVAVATWTHDSPTWRGRILSSSRVSCFLKS